MKFVPTVRLAVASAMLLFIWANHAAADLYRWVDPETGSVKFSSYPPPWYGDEAKQRHAPRVEVIAPTRTAPAVAPDSEKAPDSVVLPKPRGLARTDADLKPAVAPAERRP